MQGTANIREYKRKKHAESFNGRTLPGSPLPPHHFPASSALFTRNPLLQETDYPVTNAMSSCNRPSQQCSLYDQSVAAQLINKHRGHIQLVNKVNTSHASFFCAPLKTTIHGSARPARSSQRGKQNFVSKLWPQYHALSSTTTTTTSSTTTTTTPQSSILTVFVMKAATNGSSAPENRTLAALVRPAAAASPHDTDLR